MSDLIKLPFHDNNIKLKFMSFHQLLDGMPIEFEVSDFVDEKGDRISISTKEYLIKLIEERFSEQ